MSDLHLSDEELPRLHPAPGRCIVRIVERLGLHKPGCPRRELRSAATDCTCGKELKSASGLTVETDGRYENQPMVGTLLEIGDPRNDAERIIADWAAERDDAGDLFVFSMNAGSPYWNEQMESMVSAGYDFRWLRGLRLFDIGQLAATIANAGKYGEIVERRRVIPRLVAPVDEIPQ